MSMESSYAPQINQIKTYRRSHTHTKSAECARSTACWQTDNSDGYATMMMICANSRLPFWHIIWNGNALHFSKE